ncbi:uncharacterized protein FRV6_06623 [Fusarium oxysporum]|uniref:Uncharacterized protein n=1 Tax=Fusarium oxysporum TaxID=5507 RepID=A0A2H3TH66_FUSOX|nr:uncharacterized protein FRV6_06623 [Fusarium oxysporum]
MAISTLLNKQLTKAKGIYFPGIQKMTILPMKKTAVLERSRRVPHHLSHHLQRVTTPDLLTTLVEQVSIWDNPPTQSDALNWWIGETVRLGRATDEFWDDLKNPASAIEKTRTAHNLEARGAEQRLINESWEHFVWYFLEEAKRIELHDWAYENGFYRA